MDHVPKCESDRALWKMTKCESDRALWKITTCESDRAALWEIQCCPEVEEILHNEVQLQKHFHAKLEFLSQGEFHGNPKHCKSLTRDKGVELYETRLTDKARILWQIVPSILPRLSGRECEFKEVIRVWDIVTDHDKIYRHVQAILRKGAFKAFLKLKTKLKCTKQESMVHKNRRSPHTFVIRDDVDNKSSDKHIKSLKYK